MLQYVTGTATEATHSDSSIGTRAQPYVDQDAPPAATPAGKPPVAKWV